MLVLGVAVLLAMLFFLWLAAAAAALHAVLAALETVVGL